MFFNAKLDIICSKCTITQIFTASDAEHLFNLYLQVLLDVIINIINMINTFENMSNFII